MKKPIYEYEFKSKKLDVEFENPTLERVENNCDKRLELKK